MERPPPLTTDPLAPPFEWSELFDFTIDDQLFANLDDPTATIAPPEQPEEVPRPEPSDHRVRKRDPRLVCENFLAGRVPCACPEMDAMMQEEEESGAPGKKRPRVGRTSGGGGAGGGSGSAARCQVPGCEADISELKGYHRRHRVCLRCANAVSVLLGGESKRYCQQCGKFHVLSDFDEGKRSCRRKLERHNNRRRRKPADSRGVIEKECQGDLQTEDVSSDGEGKENPCSSSQVAEREDSKDGALSKLCSVLESQNIENDSAVTFTQVNKAVDSSKRDHSPPSYDTKSAYSSVCPTGRISFKLYDWNPAEFPRRLRHQIFQWLASMPIELEGYIRPGCTILTAFISMPHHMWVKLSEDPISYIRNSVGPGGMLSGKGTALVYLNNMSFRVLKDGASVLKVDVAMRAPKLHYIYPPCFEAGKPMDFIACGSNLFQPKFRSLISFAGKYLPHDYYVSFPHGKDKDETSVDYNHQFCRIYVPHTEPSFFGPAFIEVENEHGLSNYLPILIGDEDVCSEIKMIHEKYGCCYCPKAQLTAMCSRETCEVSCSTQTAFSEFMLDVAWFLKWPRSENLHHVMTASQIKRLSCLFNFLISNKATSVLKRILQSLRIVLEDVEFCDFTNGVGDSDKRLLKENICHARNFLRQNGHRDEVIMCQVGNFIANGKKFLQTTAGNDMRSVGHGVCQVKDMRAGKATFLERPELIGKSETVSLISGEVAMDVTDNSEWPSRSCNLKLSKKFANSRPLIFMIAAIAVCFGVCAVVFHPHKVGRFAITIRRCLFDNSL